MALCHQTHLSFFFLGTTPVSPLFLLKEREKELMSCPHLAAPGHLWQQKFISGLVSAWQHLPLAKGREQQTTPPLCFCSNGL